MQHAVIVSTSRTAIGRAGKGSLIDVRPDDMAAFAIGDALSKVPALDPAEVEDVILGNGSPAGEAGFNIARVAALLAGIEGAPGVTVNRYCASSLQAIRMATHAIRAGEGDVFVAAGVESLSRYGNGAADVGPHNGQFAAAEARTVARTEAGSETWRPFDGLPDAYIAMGQTAENVAQLEGITRAEMDEYALMSQTRATEARTSGFWDAEITPYPVGDSLVTQDDGIRPGTTLEGLSQLRPVFRPDGLITAGNACPLNDGAAAVVVMSEKRAAELEITPLARVVSSAVSAIDPEIMGLGPVEASRRALDRASMTIDDVDLVEINEAFAAQVVPSYQDLGIDLDRLNVNGGAIAVGHPFGMTGARLQNTMLNSLDWHDKSTGLITMCVGGGQGMAMILERVG